MGAPVGPNDDAGMETYFYVDLQNNVQGPYPWSHLAQWLDARYITDDLKVTRSGEERWTTLGEMRARSAGCCWWNPHRRRIAFDRFQSSPIVRWSCHQCPHRFVYRRWHNSNLLLQPS